MKLGRKIGKEGPYPTGPMKSRTMYPSFDISDDQVDEYLKTHQPKLGDEIHAKVKLKVNHMSQSETGKRIGFDVTELHPPEKSGKAPTKQDIAGMLKRGMMAG